MMYSLYDLQIMLAFKIFHCRHFADIINFFDDFSLQNKFSMLSEDFMGLFKAVPS